MLIQLDVNLQECTPQFFISVCPYIKNPRTIDSIFNIARTAYLKSREDPEEYDKAFWDSQDIFDIIAQNRYTNEITMIRLSRIPEYLTRASVAQYSRFSSVLDYLSGDEYLVVLCALLKNPLLERKIFNRLFNRTIHSKIDYDIPENLDYIDRSDWIKELVNCKFATNSQKQQLESLL